MIYATIDIESTGLNRYTDEITVIGIGLTHSIEDTKFFKAYVLDMSKPENKRKLLQIRPLRKSPLFQKKRKHLSVMVKRNPVTAETRRKVPERTTRRRL